MDKFWTLEERYLSVKMPLFMESIDPRSSQVVPLIPLSYFFGALGKDYINEIREMTVFKKLD